VLNAIILAEHSANTLTFLHVVIMANKPVPLTISSTCTLEKRQRLSPVVKCILFANKKNKIETLFEA
jgi:hypothetical protein